LQVVNDRVNVIVSLADLTGETQDNTLCFDQWIEPVDNEHPFHVFSELQVHIIKALRHFTGANIGKGKGELNLNEVIVKFTLRTIRDGNVISFNGELADIELHD